MTWATRADLESRFSVAAIAEMEDGGADVAEALTDAEAEAAGYVGKAVSLPLTSVPDTLKRMVCMIARYNLWRRDVAEDHPVYIAYRDTLKALRDIAEGRVSLPIDGGAGEVTVNGTFAVKTRAQVFTDATFAGMVL